MWLWFFSIVIYLMLDIFINYGMQFFWFFLNWIMFNMVFVIDLLYMVLFMVCFIMVLFMKCDNLKWKKWNMVGIYWLLGYLFWGVIVKLVIFGNVVFYDKWFVESEQVMVIFMLFIFFYWQIIFRKGNIVNIGYKLLFYLYWKNDIEIYMGDILKLEDLDWQWVDWLEQIYWIINCFQMLQCEKNSIILNDFCFGIIIFFFGGRIWMFIMCFKLLFDGKKVIGIVGV